MPSKGHRWIYTAMAGLLFGLLLSVPSALKAQTAMASLEGLVTDSSGAVVPGATVELVSETTNVKQTMKSDARGYYFFDFLQPASYRLTVTMAGFQTFIRSAMVLQVQQKARVDVPLIPGAVTTKVEVKGEAPRLDTVTATQGQVVNLSEMQDLPEGRSPLGFLELSPNVVGVGGNPGAGLTASFNGGRLGTTDVLMDGVTINIQDPNGGVMDNRYSPTVDLIQEMKVQTNQFSAEYGLSGNAIVTMVSRSGSNRLHGDAYEFNQTQHLSANNWFTNAGGYGNTAKPVSRYNQFGFVVGGPVWLPKVYDGRNKTFFFYHWEKITRGSANFFDTETVPSALIKTGDFSAVQNSAGTAVQIFDPTTYNAGTGLRSQYPGNVIPTLAQDPVGKNVIQYYPTATGTGTGPAHLNNFYFAGTEKAPWYQEDVKFDENFTANNRLSFRYSRTPSSSLPGADAWGAGNFMIPYTGQYSGSVSRPVQSAATYTYVINPTTILNLQGGVVRYYTSGGALGEPSNFQATSWGYASNLGMTRPPVYWTDQYALIGPDVWMGNMGASLDAQTNEQISGSLTKVKGKHTFKFGAEQRFSFNNQAGPGQTTGGFDVDMVGTKASPSGVVPAGENQGDAMATLLAGWGGNAVMGNGSTQGGFVSTSLGIDAGARQSAIFASDDFRVTSKLTLNLGFRWEVNWPFSERWNRMAAIDPYMGSPLNTYLQGQGSSAPLLKGGYMYMNPSHRHAYDADLHDYAPRFGFAYQMAPKWVARGGYGLFYGPSVDQIMNFLANGYTSTTNYNWSTNNGETLTSPFDNPFPNGMVPVTGNGLGASENLGNSLNGPVPFYNPSPRIEQWSLSIERELPGNSVVELGYTGSHGYHLGEGNARGLLNTFPVDDLKYGCLLDSCSGTAAGMTVTNGKVVNPYYAALTALAPGSAQDVPMIPLYQALSPYPQYSGVTAAPGPPMGKSFYDAGFIRYTRRMSKGLQVTAHYTWAKSLDNSTTANDGNLDWINCGAGACNQNGTALTAQDWGNLGLEKSVSINDITQRVVADGVWELPFGRGRTLGARWNRALDTVAGGWKTSGVFTLQSGPPIAPHLSGGDLGNGAGFNQRPNLTGNPVTSGNVESRLGGYLNANAFSSPAPYTFGSAPRTLNNARAPGWNELDFALFKSFYFTGDRSTYLEFRAQVSNLFNHPVFGYPNSIVNGGSFGAITSTANSPRSALLSLKLYF